MPNDRPEDFDRDTLHDYRPDPAFEIASHLSTAVTTSRDDTAIPVSARKASEVLKDYHEAFCCKDLDQDDVKDQIPASPDYSAEGWATLDVQRKCDVILKLPWKELVATAKAFLDPKPSPDFKNLVEHRAVRPYLQGLLIRCPDYFAIKDYFHDGKAISVRDPDGDVWVEPDGDLKKVMGGFVAFRNFYVNGMLKALREGAEKLDFTHKMVGSVELNSDYDITVGGVDDVAAGYEFHRAFRTAWGVESAQLFDTNLYYRDWLIVKDQKMDPSPGGGTDPSVQVQVLDFIGDIYGLVKIRRYTDAVEWCALLEATKRGVTVPGLDNPFLTAPEAAQRNLREAPSGSSEIPRFRRFELVDRIYQTQFVKPLLARTADVAAEWREWKRTHGDTRPTPPDQSPELLQQLMHFDKNGVLRAMAIAYIELGAKLRDAEGDIKRRHAGRGDFEWLQNDENGKVVPKQVAWGLEGMVEFQERASQSLSEAVLFANEAYNTQGSLWTVVGGQGGNAPVNMTLEHFLQSFNEQIGDALKELQEHLVMVREKHAEIEHLRADLGRAEAKLVKADKQIEAAGKNRAALDAAWDKVKEAHDELSKAWQAVSAQEQALNAAAEEKNVAGFYRASKYEGRMREMLQRIVDDLNKDPVVRKRIDTGRKLFPNNQAFQWDSNDLMLLTKESLMAGFFDKYVKQLLLIRKGKDSYPDFDLRRLHRALGEVEPTATPEPDREPIDAQLQELARIIETVHTAPHAPDPQADVPTGAEKRLKELLANLGVAVKVEVNRDNITAKTRELITTALSDQNFKNFKDNAERKVAEIIYGADADGYQTDLAAKADSAPWGLRHLTQHLLWHCALVNQLYRKIKSRGPMDLDVGSFVDDEPGELVANPAFGLQGAPTRPTGK